MSLFAPALQTSAVPDKAARTPAQRKIDSQLLQAIHGTAPQAAVQIDGSRRAHVEIRAEVTHATKTLVRKAKGRIVSTSPAYHSIVAWVPLARLERLAADTRITAIIPAPRALTNPKRQ